MAFDRLIQLTLRARNFLSGDVQPATESMRELTEEGQRLKASMEDVGRARGLARNLRDNLQATESLARAQADARATLDDLTSELGDNAEATAGQRIAMREARRTLDEAERAYKKNQSAIKNLTTDLKQMGVDTDNVTAEEKRLAAELEDGKKALGDNRDAIKQKRIEEKKAADTTKEHADRVDAARGFMANGAKQVLAFAAAYVSFNAVMGLVQGGLRLVAQGIRAVAMDGSDKQQALGQLEAALASTGRQAEFTAKQLLDMADAAEASSMLTAEQVQSAQARLLSYTDVAAAEFPRAMQIIIDQQQRLGISVEQSAEIVGRALQSPSEAIATLGRQGFKLEDGQKRLLRQLEATGKTAEAQAIIMGMLTEAYGGSAAAARMNTAAGLWKGLTDRVGDFTYRVGKSGAFDFIQRKLLELSTYLDEMANDGRLDALAQALSAAFIDAAARAEEFAKKLLEVDFKTLADDASRWLDGFGEKLDTAGRWITMINAPFRVLLNVVTGGIAAIGVTFTGLVTACLAGMALLAKAIPDAFGGKAIVEGLERARDTAMGMMTSLAGQVAQDGRDIAATWDSVANAAESSAERQSSAARRAADETRQAMQKNGADIASFFRTNITTLEQALAAISFSETTADLAEVEAGLKASSLSAEEMAQALAAIEVKQPFVAVVEGAISAAEQIKRLRDEQVRLREEYFAGNITLEAWQQGHNAAAGSLRELEGETAKATATTKALGAELKTLVDVQRAISDAKTDRDIAAANAALKKMLDTGIIDGAQYNAEMKRSADRLREIKAAIDGSAKAQADKNAVDKQAITTSEDLRRESGKRMEAERKAGDQAMQDRRRGSEETKRDVSAFEDYFGGVVSRARQPLAAMSAAALEFYDRLRGISSVDVSIDTGSLDATRESLERVTRALSDVQAEAAKPMISALGRWQLETQQASLKTQQAFLGQKAALQDLTETYARNDISAEQFVRRASSMRRALSLLDDSDLSGLESAISAAQQRMEQMNQSTRGTLEGLMDELDGLQGRTEEIERRKFAARQRELQLQLAEAQSGGDSQAVANAQRALGMLRLIEAETAQQRQRTEQEKRIEANKQAATPAPAAAATPSKIIRLELKGKSVDVAVSSAADETNLLSILEDAALRAL